MAVAAVAAGLAALLVLLLAFALQPLVHDDLFWHLRTGQWIAAHHRVPLTDLFSYTRFGARWITHEWGFSLLSHLVWRAGGAGGLVLLTVLLTAGTFAAVAWRALALAPPAADGPGRRPASHRLLLLALLALGLWAGSPEIFLRAALAGELLLALALAAITAYGRSGRRRWLVALAALFWVWANVHSGVLFGLLILALYALEAAVRRAAATALWLGTLAAAAALTLVNPNGLDAPLYPLLLSRILFASGIPWELGHFTAAAPAGPTAALWLLAVLLLLALLPLAQVRRLGGAEAATMAFFALASVRSHRFVFDLVVVALPTLYKLLVLPPPSPPSSGAARLRGLAGRPALAAAVALLFLLPLAPLPLTAAAAWARRPPAAGGLIAEPFPEAALRFVVRQGIAGPHDRIFNAQNLGGFIGWRLGVPVFWDGRNDVFAELVRQVATTPFGLTASRHQFDYLLITEHDLPGIQPEIAAGRWGLVYWDDFNALYLRRDQRYAPLLARLELRLLPPFGGSPGLSAWIAAAGAPAAAAARAELAQVLAANPANQRALYFSAVISLDRGEPRRAAQELAAAARIRPSEEVDRAWDLLRHTPVVYSAAH